MSSDDDVFAMHYGISGNSIGYLVYKRSTDTVLLHVNNEGDINEVEIDKSGRYLISHKDDDSLHVWDLQGNPTRTTITNEFFNHRGMGYGVVGSYCSGNRICKRDLATPNTVTYLLSGVGGAGSQGAHFSLIGPDNWLLLSRYPNPTAPVGAAYDNEIFLIAMDGTGVRRMVHHRVHSFAGDPHPAYATSSMDGRYTSWASNWDGANTSVPRHVYVADMVPSDTTAPQPPANLTVLP